LENWQLEPIIEKAEKYSIAVLIDEAYYGFCEETAFDLTFKHSNVMIARTFNKAWGLAALRSGFFLSSTEINRLAYKFRPLYEINGFACEALYYLLDHYQEVSQYLKAEKEGRQYLAEELQRLGLEVINTKTNFIHVNCGPYFEQIRNEFAKQKILTGRTVDESLYKNWMRLTTGPKDMMEIPVRVIGKIVNSAHIIQKS
jgi:histidinol-phosphate aminotransferase